MQWPHILKQPAILACIYKLQDKIKLVSELVLYLTISHEYSEISSILNILLDGIRFQLPPERRIPCRLFHLIHITGMRG